MNLTQGRSYLAIPGPSVVPDRVLAAMHRASPDIYGAALHDMTRKLQDDLKRLAGTGQHLAIYIANGHGVWEAANANLFSSGDKVLVLVTGFFGTAWAGITAHAGVEVEMLDFGAAAAADPARLKERLRQDPGRRIKAVMVTHTDTASSVRNDLPAIRAAIDAAGHPALFMVDAIASMGCDPLEMDDTGIDVVLAASQKGLMLPPGLGFVWFSERARQAAGQGAPVSRYWDWQPRAFAQEYYQNFAGTAPTHHLFGLSEALSMILAEEGLAHVWARHRRLAEAVWAAVGAWGEGGDVRLNVAAPEARSSSVTLVRFGGGVAGALRAWCRDTAGVTLGIPLGIAAPDEPAYADYLRIGHMGHVNAHMVLGLLAAIEAGLQAQGAPHGTGAIERAAAVLAAP